MTAALDGIRVLSAAESLAATWCARTLADYGADVITIEPPGGNMVRRLGPFNNDDESLPATYALANQHLVNFNPEEVTQHPHMIELIRTSDILIESRTPGLLEALGTSFDKLRRSYPELIVATITSNGAIGPRAGQIGNDLTNFARSGWAAINGPAGRTPLKGSGYIASYLSGVMASGAVLAALRARARNGRGQLVDVAESDVLATTFASIATHAQYQAETGKRRVMWFEDPLGGPIPAADGEFMLMLGRGDFFRHAMIALDLPALAQDERFQDREYRLTHAKEWTPAVRERVATRPKMELFEELTTMRVAAGPVLSIRELATDEHLAKRGFFVRPDDNPNSPRYPGPPARLSATPWRLRFETPVAREHTALHSKGTGRMNKSSPMPSSDVRGPLAGLRVLALTQVWAGSYCAQQLALLGAEVIKIEARRRPDQWRGGYAMSILPALRERPEAQHGWNCHPSFNSGNLNQLGLTLDLQTDQGIDLLRTLLHSTDIVVENFTPRVLSSLGISYATMRTLRPNIILCSISGFGATGPYANRPSNGGTIEPASGMSSLLGFRGEGPRNSGATFPDPAAAASAFVAILAALQHRDRTGEGQHIDVSMQEAALTLIGDAVLEFETTGRERERSGNRHPTFAPHGIYPSNGDDRWIALAAEDEQQWQALCAIADGQQWHTDPRFKTNADRKENEDLLDTVISRWTEVQSRDELAVLLAAAGLPAAPVLMPGEVPHDLAFRARGVVAEIEHPEVGSWAYPVIASRLSETPATVTRPAPCLGEHSAELLERLAGIGKQHYQELVQLGVTGTDPPN